MSFANREDVQDIIEGLIKRIWKDVKKMDLNTPFPRLNYRDAISWYGSDKPDTRYDLKIRNVTDEYAKNPSATQLFNQFANQSSEGGQVEMLRIPKGSKTFAGKKIEELENLIIENNLPKENYRILKVSEGNKLNKPFSNESEAFKNIIFLDWGFEPGDIGIFLASHALINPGSTPMGKIRTFCANHLKAEGRLSIPADQFNFLWVENFPLFSPVESNQARKFDTELPPLESTHNPFTSPIFTPEIADHFKEIIHLTNLKSQMVEIRSDIALKVLGNHYDLVLNGSEIGGGSIRIHDHHLQLFVLRNILKLPESEIGRFQHWLDALKHGCPPHGGIALGFDRLMAILCGGDSLRDVIAFPKSFSGNELMVGSPSSVSDQILKDYHLTVVD